MELGGNKKHAARGKYINMEPGGNIKNMKLKESKKHEARGKIKT